MRNPKQNFQHIFVHRICLDCLLKPIAQPGESQVPRHRSRALHHAQHHGRGNDAATKGGGCALGTARNEGVQPAAVFDRGLDWNTAAMERSEGSGFLWGLLLVVIETIENSWFPRPLCDLYTCAEHIWFLPPLICTVGAKYQLLSIAAICDFQVIIRWRTLKSEHAGRMGTGRERGRLCQNLLGTWCLPIARIKATGVLSHTTLTTRSHWIPKLIY